MSEAIFRSQFAPQPEWLRVVPHKVETPCNGGVHDGWVAQIERTEKARITQLAF